MEARDFSSITSQFGIGLCLNVKPIGWGKVNSTFRVETERGTFILQQLKPPLDEKTALDGHALTVHLIRKGFPVPVFLLTNEGLPYVKDPVGTYRLMTCLEGHTLEAMDSSRKAFFAGELVGRFHRALSDFDYKPLAKLKEVHDATHVLSRLEKLASDPPLRALEVEHILLELESEIPLQLLPENLPLRPIHGDLKYTNILFDDHGRPFALLDFDTLMISTLPVEMGDAFRSWCTRKHTPQGPIFDQTLFRSAWKGYLFAKPPISKQEKACIIQGIKLLLLELSARYLVDYFEDYFFAWDSRRFPDRASHNLFRSRRQLTVFADLEKKEDELRKIVEETR
jgi:Ser/Thr protein kinase RdoA (MazF antagonist)